MVQGKREQPRGAALRAVAFIAGFFMLILGLTLALDRPTHGSRIAGIVLTAVGLSSMVLALLLDELLRRRRRRISPGAPLHAEGKLTLSAAEATAGTTKKATVRARHLCRRCTGTTWRSGRRCRRCRKTGLGRTVRRTVTLRIPAGTRDGAIVRVRGAGTPGIDGLRPAGDLRVRVRVRGATAPSAPSGRPTRDTRDGRTAPAGTSTAPAGGTVTSDKMIVSADASGFTVVRRLAGRQETALTLRWPQLRRLAFDTAPHDEVIALYAWTTDGARTYALDAALLTRPQWRALADHVHRASAGSVTLDLASRDGPHL